ncbi:hypothetical protein CLV37_106134 [Kineococcus rhizosphaerae]|uniref:Uncharacterized protein n=1 Tax=Kineococcus rhizosphaerae TaxID=559628 RepID=A0A2T0R3F7_9ACTN|nr:hypothetical protein CLV37_106134 [Kineococcus rhizosphaerae]
MAWGAGCGAVLGGLYFPVAAVLAALNGASGEVGTVVLGLLPAAAAGALVGVLAAMAASGLVALVPRRRRRGWGLTLGAAVLAAVVSGAAPGAVAYVSDGDFPSGWAAVVAAVALLPAVWVLRRLVREPAEPTPR